LRDEVAGKFVQVLRIDRGVDLCKRIEPDRNATVERGGNGHGNVREDRGNGRGHPAVGSDGARPAEVMA